MVQLKHIFDSKFYILGDGKASLDEVGSPRFLLLVSACWNGIAMGAIDLARRHVITKEHADIGMRIADYPTIQVRNRVFFNLRVCYGPLNFTSYAVERAEPEI